MPDGVTLIPDAEALIARAAALRPQIRAEAAEAAEAAERGCYSPALHQAFRDAGFYRLTQPRRFGGTELPLPVFYKIMLEIARGDPGTGWCLALGASHGFVLASHYEEQAQVELFGDGEFIAPHRAQPLGAATPVADGWRIEGRWNYCSGIPYATHVMLTARVPEDPPRLVLAVVPRAAVTVLPDWGGERVLGMRASGSNSIEVAGAVIPAHHAVPFHALFGSPAGMEDGTPGTRLHGNPMYLGRLMGPYHATLVSMAVGAAWAAIDEYERLALSGYTPLDPTLLKADWVEVQRPLGLAIAGAEAAEAILLAGAQRYMDLCARWARDGTPISVEDNFRLWTMIQQGGRMASEVVEDLFHRGGAFNTKSGSTLLRYFGDVQMYRTHSSAQYEEFATYAARAHLGRPTGFRGL